MITVKPNRKIDLVEFKKFLETLDFELPDDYTAFLKGSNGGQPEENIVKIGFDDSLSFFITSFLGIGTKDEIDDIKWNVNVLKDRIPTGYVPIARAEGGNFICINLNHDNWGQIYLWLHEEEIVYRIAPSFNELMRTIKSYDPSVEDLNDYKVLNVWIDHKFLEEIEGE